MRTETVAPDVPLRSVVVLDADERAYRVDEETALDLDVTAAEVFGDGPGHMVVSSCRTVAVTVAYGGADTVVRVHPSARLRRVRRLAIDEFGIPPVDAADLVLRLPGSDVDLELSTPVAAIVPRRTCVVTVDLVHTVRPQG